MHGLGLCLFLADDQHEAEAAEPEGQRAGNEHGTLLLLLDVTGSGLPCAIKMGFLRLPLIKYLSGMTGLSNPASRGGVVERLIVMGDRGRDVVNWDVPAFPGPNNLRSVVDDVFGSRYWDEPTKTV